MTDPGPCVVGIDFGTLSARAVVVRVADGAGLGSAVAHYRSGVVEGHMPDGAPLPRIMRSKTRRTGWKR